MIAKLSDDLASALERNGDRPLTVENPRTNKLYVLLAMDRYVGSDADSTPVAWDETKNARRFELIRKDVSCAISQNEAAELAMLQRTVDAYLRRVAPLPWIEMQQLHGELMNRARANGEQK